MGLRLLLGRRRIERTHRALFAAFATTLAAQIVMMRATPRVRQA